MREQCRADRPSPSVVCTLSKIESRNSQWCVMLRAQPCQRILRSSWGEADETLVGHTDPAVRDQAVRCVMGST